MNALQKYFSPLYALLPLLTFVFSACHSARPDEEDNDAFSAKTPVQVTTVYTKALYKSIELRATSLFLKKVSVKANATGYIDDITVSIGDNVRPGQVLFTLKTKEATAIENQKPETDSMLDFSGLLKIRAQKNGIVTLLAHQKGDYVQDGDELALIAERASLAFILDVPFELRRHVKPGTGCTLILPDSTVLRATVRSALPTVDALSQTQSYIVAAAGEQNLPENLIAKVRIITDTKAQAQVLPKSALLADETQTQFWVMKLINDTTAIRVPVTKGIETDNEAEITAPLFGPGDRIILSGNYGLPDTANVFTGNKTGKME